MSQVAPAEDQIKPEITSSELNYAQYHLNRSFFTYRNYSQQGGSSSASVTVSGGQTIIFEIGPGFYNLSKSYLTFYTSIPALGAGNYANQWVEGMPMFRQIQIKGKQSGTIINEIRYLNKYLKTILRRSMSKIEALSLDTPNAATAAPVVADGVCEGLTYTANAVATNTITARPTAGADTRESMVVGGNPEPAYLLPGAANAVEALQWRLPFSLIKDSFFSNGKTLYFPESVYITLTLDTVIGSYFINTSATIPTTGAADATTAMSINNLSLNMACEENIAVQEKLREAVNNGGVRINIDTVESLITNIAGTAHNLQSRYNGVFGSKLQKFWWAPFSTNDGTKNTYYDCDNSAGSKLTSFYISIDNKRYNQNNYNELIGDSYFEVRDKLKGSTISSMSQYYYNFAYMIDFTSNYNLIDRTGPPEQNFNDGLDLSTEKRIDVVCTAAATLNHYTFAVMSNTLLITKDGFFLNR